MTKGLVTCHVCGTEMIRQYDGGKTKLRASILVWENGRCIGKCRKCGADVPLQLSLVAGNPLPKKRTIHIVMGDEKNKTPKVQ